MLHATTATLIQRKRQHQVLSNDNSRPTSSRSHRVSFRHASRITLVQRSVASIRILNLLDLFQSLLALTSALLWMVQSYPPYSYKLNIVYIQFVITVVYICDLLLRLTISGASYVQTRWAVFDFVTILPILYFMYQLGWYNSSNPSTATNGFIAFITALAPVWSWLTVARFLRVFKLLRITELRSMTFLFPNALTRAVVSLTLTILMIIVLGGALMFVIENAWSYGEPATFQQWLYFMVVTISTVGYGDITPKTVLGQCMIMLIIMFAIIVVPAQISDFGTALSDHYKGGLAYRRANPHVVLVVPSAMSIEDLDILLEEFFQGHHTLQAYHAVLLSNGGEEHREALLAHVRSTQYWTQISYIVGSPSSPEDLDKAAVDRAQAVFLLSAVNFDSVESERELDEQALRRAISIKHYCPYVPLILTLSSPRARGHVLWAELSRYSDIRCVCLNEDKMRLFATTAAAPGAVGLLTNLLQSSDGKSSAEAMVIGSAASGAEPDRAMESFAAQSLVSQPLHVSAWPLTTSVCPPTPSPPTIDHPSASLFFSAATRRWDEEYLAGYNQRLFACELPPALDGLSFSEAGAMLYERLTLVLVSLYRADSVTGKLRVLLSPGWGEVVEVRTGDIACVIAQSEEHAEAAKTVEYQPSIGERWRHARETDEARGTTARVNGLHCRGRLISPLLPPSAARHAPVPDKSAKRLQGVDATTALSKYVSDPEKRIDPVTGGIAVDSASPSRRKSEQPSLVAVEVGKSEYELDRKDQAGDEMGVVRGSSSREGEEGWSGHVVVCGHVDTRIVGFLHRFRQTDDRPIILVPTSSSFSSAAQHYLSSIYPAVTVIKAHEDDGEKDEGGEEDSSLDALLLGYTHPCYGHCHSSPASQPNQFYSSQLVDEFCSADQQAAAALRSTKQATSSTASKAMFALDGSGSLDDDEAMKRSSWYRRASVHTAASVFILADPYTSSGDSSDDSVDDQSRADSVAVNLYIALRGHLELCRLQLCPTMRPSTSTPSLSIELLYHNNARLLHRHSQSPVVFRPHQAQSTGALWIYQLVLPYFQRGSSQARQLQARAEAADKREKHKLSKQMQLNHTNLQAEQQLDSGERELDIDLGGRPADSDPSRQSDEDDGPLSDSTARAAQQLNLQQRAKAFFTSDGHVFSAKLLDSLVVQAFYHPLVFDTFHALIELPSHSASGLTFRTELILLDLRVQWIGRSYGFVVLSCQLDMGWAVLGVYRDRRAVDEMSRATRQAGREAHGGQKAAERGKNSEGGGGESESEGPLFYVLTNPPPDTVLHQHDRLFTLSQR